MRLDVKALAITCAVLWGGAVLLVGLAATLQDAPTGAYYGRTFLQVLASVYPGYEATPRLADTLVGTGYALVDGAICGALLAWIYNLVAGRARKVA